MKRMIGRILKGFSMSVLALSLSAPLMASISMYKKEDYYEQYKEIIQEAQETYNAQNIKLIPFNELSDEDFLDPEEFKEVVNDIAQGNYTVTFDAASNAENNRIMPRSSGSATKTATVTSNSRTFSLDITAEFTTQYNTTHKRQMFSKFNGVDVECTSTNASWDHDGFGYRFYDTNRTCDVTVQGYIKYGSMAFGLLDATVTFYCDSKGGIS